MADLQNRFIDIYERYITRDGADSLLKWMRQSDFFNAPASTKYHGNYAGGLVEHSLNVYDCLVSELCSSGLNSAFSEETIAIVSLLHDICKANTYKVGKRNVKNESGQWVTKDVYEHDEEFPCGHGEKSLIIIQNYMKLTLDEVYAIRAHMGGFDVSVKGGDFFIGKIFEKSNLALLLHLADMKATYLLEKKE